MAKRTPILDIKPLSQTNSMKKMAALGNFRTLHFLVADRTNVIQPPQLLCISFWQGINFVNSSSPFHKNIPASGRLAIDVKIRMDAHHDGSDRASGFEDEDPEAVEKEDDSKSKLHCVSKGSDDVNAVVELFPKSASISVKEKEKVDRQGNNYLDNDLDAENGNSEHPGTDCEVGPEEDQERSWKEDEKGADC